MKATYFVESGDTAGDSGLTCDIEVRLVMGFRGDPGVVVLELTGVVRVSEALLGDVGCCCTSIRLLDV